MDWKEKRSKFIMQDNFNGKGPCLIPKPGREVPSCHENDFCECDMCDAYAEGYKNAIDDILGGIQREQQYHEWIDKEGSQVRHPVLACKEIASYARALKASTDTAIAGEAASVARCNGENERS